MHHSIRLEENQELRIQAEEKPSKLLATGELSKEDIELNLEALLAKALGKEEVEIIAEPMTDMPGKWLISVGYEGMSYETAVFR